MRASPGASVITRRRGETGRKIFDNSHRLRKTSSPRGSWTGNRAIESLMWKRAMDKRRKRNKREGEGRRQRATVHERACNRRLISRTSRDVSLRRWCTWLRCLNLFEGWYVVRFYADGFCRLIYSRLRRIYRDAVLFKMLRAMYERLP